MENTKDEAIPDLVAEPSTESAEGGPVEAMPELVAESSAESAEGGPVEATESDSAAIECREAMPDLVAESEAEFVEVGPAEATESAAVECREEVGEPAQDVTEQTQEISDQEEKQECGATEEEEIGARQDGFVLSEEADRQPLETHGDATDLEVPVGLSSFFGLTNDTSLEHRDFQVVDIHAPASGSKAHSRKVKHEPQIHNEDECNQPFDFFSVNYRHPCEGSSPVATCPASPVSHSKSPSNAVKPVVSSDVKGPGGFVYRGAKRRHKPVRNSEQHQSNLQASSGKIAPKCMSPPGYVTRETPVSDGVSAAQRRGQEVELLKDGLSSVLAGCAVAATHGPVELAQAANISAASGRHLRAQQRMFMRLCPGKGLPSGVQFDSEDGELSSPSKEIVPATVKEKETPRTTPEAVETSSTGCQTLTPPPSAPKPPGVYRKVVTRNVKVLSDREVPFEKHNWVRLPPVATEQDTMRYTRHIGHFFPCVPAAADQPYPVTRTLVPPIAERNERRGIFNRWRC